MNLSAVMMECGGEAIRVHIGSFDITKAKDVSRLIAIIEDNPGCDLRASIPCGPWSTWQYVNLSIHGAEFASHLNDLRRNSQVMFAAFLRASRAVRRGGGKVAFEWPRHCLGWKQPFMQRFLADPDVETVDFDGCDFGMQDKDGMPIRKQWKVATTSKELIDELSGRKCKHEKGYLHARIEGSVTPTTALYPSEMCEAIVRAWYPDGTFKKVASAMPVEVDPVEQRWKKKPNTLYVSLNGETAKIPTRATSGSAGLDTYASEGACIPAGGSAWRCISPVNVGRIPISPLNANLVIKRLCPCPKHATWKTCFRNKNLLQQVAPLESSFDWVQLRCVSHRPSQARLSALADTGPHAYNSVTLPHRLPQLFLLPRTCCHLSM